MITRLLLDADRLLKKAKSQLEWRKRVVVPDNTWDALSDAHRAIMTLSMDLHYESGRSMAFGPKNKDAPPLNPRAYEWAHKIERIEMDLTRAMWGLRREHPKPQEQVDAENEAIISDTNAVFER